MRDNPAPSAERPRRPRGDARSAALTQLLLRYALAERGDTAVARETLATATHSPRATECGPGRCWIWSPVVT
jgi:hypothetical protein